MIDVEDVQKFNPKLTEWLNARDYVSGDWPGNVPSQVQLDADREVGGGFILDEHGWPTKKRLPTPEETVERWAPVLQALADGDKEN